MSRVADAMRGAGNFVVRFLVPLLLGALPGGSWAADPVPPLVLERSIPLIGVSGRIDHMAIDLGRKRLFVAELANGTVDVIDLASGKAVHRLSGLREPQGIGYAPKADVIAIASAGDGSVRLFRGEALRLFVFRGSDANILGAPVPTRAGNSSSGPRRSRRVRRRNA